MFSILQNLSTLVFGFGGFYLLVRVLSKEDFGGWTLFLTVTSLLEVARVGFVKNGFIKFRASALEEMHGTIFTASLLLNSCFALAVSAGMLLFGDDLARLWNTPQLESMFQIYAITSLILIPFFQFEFLLHAVLDFRSVFFSYFIRNGVLFCGILLSYLGAYRLNLFMLVGFHLTGALVASVITYFLVKNVLSFHRRIHGEWVWKLVHYGKYVIGTSLSAMLYGSVDQFMLGSLLSTASVAIYSVVYRITSLINIPSTTLSTIMFPRSAQLMSSGGAAPVKQLYEKSVGTVLGIVLPAVTFIFIFPEFVIGIIAGPGYAEAVPLLKIVILFSLFMLFSFQFGTVFDSIGYPNLNFYVTSINLTVNIILNYFLISNYGIIGAVYGTSFTTVTGFLVMQTLLKRKLDVNTLNVFGYTLEFYKSCFRVIGSFFNKKVSHETEE